MSFNIIKSIILYLILVWEIKVKSIFVLIIQKIKFFLYSKILTHLQSFLIKISFADLEFLTFFIILSCFFSYKVSWNCFVSYKDVLSSYFESLDRTNMLLLCKFNFHYINTYCLRFKFKASIDNQYCNKINHVIL